MLWIGEESTALSSSIAYERNIAKHFSYNIGYSYRSTRLQTNLKLNN
jgi:hypothetical protein